MGGALQISRLLSLAAAVVVLFIELQGSAAMRATLVGARGPLRASSNYTSSLMPRVAAALMANRSLPVQGPVPRLLYIDADDSPEGYGVSASQCASPLPGDRIYAPSYLAQLLPRVLAAAPGAPEPATILIDCTFTARVVQDTTALKVHWVDANATSLSTLFLQTMVLKRPTKRLSMACGVATLTSLALASSAAVSASYVHGVGLDFPYVLSAFTPLELAPTLTLDGMWQGTLGGSAGETIHVAGTEGIYRVAHSTQANYDHYIWALPTNPFEFVEIVSYLTTDMSKDSFAWVRMLLSMGVGLTLLVRFTVALLVALHMYLAHRVLWVPDVFPCVQTRLQLRALLCLLVLACTNAWHLYEYALCTANAREGWTNSFVLTDIIRADALMVYLGLMITLAKSMRIRLRLEVAVSIYVLCYELSDDMLVRSPLGIQVAAANAFVKANYLENILEAHVDGMDLWTSHENFRTNGAVVAAQMTWWVVASCLCFGYALAAKGCNMVDMDRRRCMTWRYMHHMRLRSEDVVHTFGTQSASRRRQSSRQPSKVGPVGPVRKTFSFQDVSSVAVEAVLHTPLCQVYGLVAPLDEYVAVGGWSYVSASSVWLLGYVLVDGVYLVHVNDYPLLLLNALLRRSVFRVYGFHVIEATIHAEKTRLLPSTIPIRRLLHTTVCDLR